MFAKEKMPAAIIVSTTGDARFAPRQFMHWFSVRYTFSGKIRAGSCQGFRRGRNVRHSELLQRSVCRIKKKRALQTPSDNRRIQCSRTIFDKTSAFP
jgi:hypothetical protein